MRPNGVGPFHNLSVDYNLDLNWSADWRLPRGTNMNLRSQVQLPSYDFVGLQAALERPQFDTREIQQSGVSFERNDDVVLAVFFTSDTSRRLYASGDLFGYRGFEHPPSPAYYGWGWDLSLTWHPTNSRETRVDSSYGHKPQGPRWIESTSDNQAVFGFQDPEFLSITLREQVVLTPRLTLQVYAQLFSDAERYGPFYGVPLSGDRVELAQLSPISYGSNPNGHFSVLNINAVPRWEYRLGSILWLVYTRSQSELAPSGNQAVATSVLPSRLLGGALNETWMVKWSHWFNG